MNGLITTSGMERIGKRAHKLSDKGDVPGSIMLAGSVIGDLRDMFNRGPKALYDSWVKQPCHRVERFLIHAAPVRRLCTIRGSSSLQNSITLNRTVMTLR